MDKSKTVEKVFGEQSHILTFAKDETVLKEAKVESHIYRLISGSVAFLILHQGEYICKNFYFRTGDFFSSYASFLTRTPSEYSIVALEKTVLESISYNNLQTAYELSAEHQKKGRLMAERLFIEESRRTTSLILKSAEERYLEILEQKSDIIRQIPLKYLASYLGITPSSLSRLRKKISSSH